VHHTEEHKAPWQIPWMEHNMQSTEWTFASALKANFFPWSWKTQVSKKNCSNLAIWWHTFSKL